MVLQRFGLKRKNTLKVVQGGAKIKLSCKIYHRDVKDFKLVIIRARQGRNGGRDDDSRRRLRKANGDGRYISKTGIEGIWLIMNELCRLTTVAKISALFIHLLKPSPLPLDIHSEPTISLTDRITL